ncbi:hypothetical protein ACP70R_014611 [Stipagrostis hirtigluma subsp. patula]
MAFNYYRSTWCGPAAASKHNNKEIEACALVVATLRQKRRWGGSVVGHQTKRRDRISGDIRLNNDYFVERPLFNSEDFRRRFRMQRSLVLEIEDKISAANDFFKQRRDCAGVLGFSTRQKCTVALRMLAYGGPADFLDEGLRMGESTILKTVMEFATTIIEVFGDEFLRPPSESELEHILAVNDARGFPGMIGSIDCMHWQWANCPTSLAGMYKGHKGKPTVILEAVATKDLRIWHAFFGLPGSHNDINVLHRSPVFDDLAKGNTPAVDFTVNGNPYTLGYYLGDGIYPDWATIVKSVSGPVSNKQTVFAAQQEACRKDVERCFGVLQAKWKILHRPARLWNQTDLNTIMRACVILHNMVLEDERGVNLPNVHVSEWPGAANPPITPLRTVHGIDEYMEAYSLIQDKSTHQQLKLDLIDHMWQLYGSKSGPFAPSP